MSLGNFHHLVYIALIRDTVSMPTRRPGDHILDRHLPNANESTREEARENLRRLVELVIRVNERLMAQSPQGGIRESDMTAVDSESSHPTV